MPRILAGLCCSLLLAAPLAAQLPADTAQPHHPGVDVLHYDLSLDLPERGAAIAGHAVLTLRRTAPVDTLVLDLRHLPVEEVRVGDRAAAFRRDSARVHVALPPGAGDTLRVAVRYGGVPRDGLIVREEDGVWTAFGDNWPDRARHWFPGVDHPSDKATVAWSVTAPEARVVVANGVLVEQRVLDGGRALTRWRSDRPLATYMMVIGAGPLRVTDLGDTACGLAERPGCVPQVVYTLPGVEGFVPGPFAEADEIVEFFARLVAPFPYEKLAHVQSATRFGGMENASAIFYSDQAFRTGTLGTGLIAHETAHQWFGDAVTQRDWAHLWLSEGFADYFAELWTEHDRGRDAFRLAMDGLRQEVLGSDAVAGRPVIDSLQTDYLKLLNANSYQKGAWVLHMLRGQVGDSAFFRGVRDYYAAHRHDNALTHDLRAAMERASGQELGWFFEQWLRRPGFPVLEAGLARQGDGVGLLVAQRQPGEPFRFPLTVEITDEDGARRRATVQVEALREQVIALPAGMAERAAEMVLDPDVALLFQVGAVRF